MNSFMQRGFAAVQARNPAEAVEWFAKALQENPKDAQASAWLGQSLCSIGRRNEGQGFLRQAGRNFLENSQASRDIGPVLEIIQQLLQWNDLAGALELSSQAVQINNSDVRGFHILALTHSQLNNMPEALNAARQALSIIPQNNMLQVLLASLEADAGLYADARQRLERLLRGKLDVREKFRTHKELGRVLDKLGEYASVFPHLHAAAGLAGSLPEFSRQDAAFVPNMLKTNKAGFNREILGRWSGAEFPRKLGPPVFLVGFFRSGTTLTQEVLGAHPEVFVADEADFIWAMHRELHCMNRSSASTVEKFRELDLDGIKHLREFYWQRVRGRFGEKPGQKVFVDKFTMNTIDLGLINCVFPDSRVIFVMRDPRDVCLSCFMQLMVPTPSTVHLLSWRGTVDFYAQLMDWWMYIKQQMTLRFIEFRYEDAVTLFEPTYRRIFDFLGLSWDPAVANFYQHAKGKFISSPSRGQVAQPLYSSSVARWRHYESEFTPISATLQPLISAFGYPSF